MMTKEEKRKKAAIVKLLKGKKCYEKEIDDQLIDQYLFNLKIISEAQQDVATRGVMSCIRSLEELVFEEVLF